MARECQGSVALLCTAVLLFSACSTPSVPQASDPPAVDTDEPIPPSGIPKTYIAAHGLNGVEFGTTLAELKSRFPRLTEIGEPTAIEWSGKTRSVDFSGCLHFQKNGGCDNPVISADVEVGGGTVLFATYYIESPWEGFTEGYRFADTGGVLVPVLIDVCAHYAGQGEQAVPSTLPYDARVCAFQGYHHTYLDEYANKDGTHTENDGQSVPMYRRVFFGLVNTYGYPQHYRPIGRIVIELADGTRLTSDPAPRYIDYHWGRGQEVTIDYAFNPRDGAGIVLLADAWARDYAQKRHDMGDPNFVLWRLGQPGGMNRREFVSKFQSGSLAIMDLDARSESGRVSERVRALFPTHAQ